MLRRIADHPAARLYELLPWRWHYPGGEPLQRGPFADPRPNGMIAFDQQGETTMVDLEVSVEGVALDALDAFLSSDNCLAMLPPDRPA